MGHLLGGSERRYASMKELTAQGYGIKDLCEALEVSRSGYHAFCHRGKSQRLEENVRILQEMEAVFLSSRKTYGSPRIKAALNQAGFVCGKNRVARLMREHGLCAVKKRRYRPRTTDSKHDHPIARNHWAEQKPAVRPNEVWLADITYVDTQEGWLYLAGVMDACSRKIVGWGMDQQMPTELTSGAFQQAVDRQNPLEGLLHHSDRGSQYASTEYRKLLEDHGVLASMSRAGNCYDNAMMESFWGTLKTECFQGVVPETRQQARQMIFEYIEMFYNRVRLHSSLGYQSPVDFENKLN